MRIQQASTAATAAMGREEAVRRYREVRRLSLVLAEPLSPEDMVVQVEPWASPTKWHLGHTTWFFETFALEAHEPGFRSVDERFRVIFNSYYNAVGQQHPRSRRGVLTRPGLGEVMAYRDTVDDRVIRLLRSCDAATFDDLWPVIELGLQHEQQHQELLLTDIKILLHASPMSPAYREGDGPSASGPAVGPPGWIGFDAGVVEIGWAGGGFAYDNEGPRHRRFVEAFELADRTVTNGEFLAFIEDGGYGEPRWWLDAGWACVRARGWSCPLYWSRDGDGSWMGFTLDGVRPLDPDAPACHLSFFEADAYARWAGARLPTEVEWEHAVGDGAVAGNFVESLRLQPQRATPGEAAGIRQAYGDVWEWTRSAHEPYPGYAPPAGAIGEYNGKFMCGTFVLRGGSCVTSASHVRRTYRNFFEPSARWQFAGLRLARSTR